MGRAYKRDVTTTDAGGVTFATVDLSDHEFKGFYQGFSNAILWPLLHYRVGLMEYKRDELETYLDVNRMFAEHLALLLAPDDIVWVHDYHLFPMGEALRKLGVANRIGFFLHIPFPPQALFAALPGGAQLVRSLASYDLVGVQTDQDRDQQNECLAQLVAVLVGLDAAPKPSPSASTPPSSRPRPNAPSARPKPSA